jgi:hypothetical protein
MYSEGSHCGRSAMVEIPYCSKKTNICNPKVLANCPRFGLALAYERLSEPCRSRAYWPGLTAL